jgi:hypothetical protein
MDDGSGDQTCAGEIIDGACVESADTGGGDMGSYEDTSAGDTAGFEDTGGGDTGGYEDTGSGEEFIPEE